MSARILVVDDLPSNVKLLEAKLAAQYFEVLSATNGKDAIELCRDGLCDLLLLDAMMPGMDGFEVCARLKADPATGYLPVVMMMAFDEPNDRVRGLEAGADDFINRPIDDLALLSRLRSLTRLKSMFDELQARSQVSNALGRVDGPMGRETGDLARGRVLVVEERANSAARIMAGLRFFHHVEVEPSPQEALFRAADSDYDAVIISLGLSGFDALRLCSQLRSLERTRALPMLLLADLHERPRLQRGLDLGVNDFILRPVERNELVARVRTEVRRKRCADRLRLDVQAAIELATVDSLTGLNNRRFFESQLSQALDRAFRAGAPLSLMILDIDHFKSVNDTYGHDAGDLVLKAFAQRIRSAVRSADIVCRLGGEEFVVIMLDTSLDHARGIAERVRGVVESAPFPVDPTGEQKISVTSSIGVAARGADARADALMRRADKALYRAKAAGRNRVTAAAMERRSGSGGLAGDARLNYTAGDDVTPSGLPQEASE